MNLWKLHFNELDCGAFQNTNHRRVRFDMRENVGADGEGEVDISYTHTNIRLTLSGHSLTATTQTTALHKGLEIKLDGRTIGKQDSTGLLRVYDRCKSTLQVVSDSRERRFLWARVQGLNLWQTIRYANPDYALLVADDAVLASFAGNPLNGAPLLTAADAALVEDWSEEKQWCAFTLCIQRLGQYRLHQHRDPRLEGRSLPSIPSCALLGNTDEPTLSISPQDWGKGPSMWDIVLERATRWAQCWLLPLSLFTWAAISHPNTVLSVLAATLLGAWIRYALLPDTKCPPLHYSSCKQ
ncbi:MAG: hypothetical protein IJN29_06960 [Akkermansia sp.]|nr:hypothetical protein [Akkermansia sp.]